MRIRYTRKALVQLDAILQFVHEQSPRGAMKIKRSIVSSISRLTRFPYSCRETEYPGIRLLSITKYRYLVFYAVDDAKQEVQILRIRHSSQDPSRHLD